MEAGHLVPTGGHDTAMDDMAGVFALLCLPEATTCIRSDHSITMIRGD